MLVSSIVIATALCGPASPVVPALALQRAALAQLPPEAMAVESETAPADDAAARDEGAKKAQEAAAAQAARAAAEALQAEVDRLVHDLDAPELAEREAAETALGKLAPAALEWLPPDDATLSPEVQQRLARARKQLQQRAAEAAIEPTTITLDARRMPLSQVLAAISAQSGNQVVDYRKQFGGAVNDPLLTLSFTQTPFWQAIDQTLDQAEMSIYPYGQERGVHIVARSPDQAPRVYHADYMGPFRIEPVSITARRDLRAKDQGSLQLALELAWEPRIRPIIIRQQRETISATDEQGQPLVPVGRQANLEVDGTSATAAVELLLPFELPPRSVRWIANLRGKLELLLPGKTEKFEFDKLADAKGAQQRRAGVAVTVDEARQNGDLWQVAMRVHFDNAGEALQSHRGWVFQNEAYLVDRDGKKVPYDVFETTRQTEDEVGVTYGFVIDGGLEGCKFVYETPAALIGVDIDYQLKDIKLP